MGIVTSFQNILDNIFIPLFEVTVDPDSHPQLHVFLKQVFYLSFTMSWFPVWMLVQFLYFSIIRSWKSTLCYCCKVAISVELLQLCYEGALSHASAKELCIFMLYLTWVNNICFQWVLIQLFWLAILAIHHIIQLICFELSGCWVRFSRWWKQAWTTPDKTHAHSISVDQRVQSCLLILCVLLLC